MEVVGCPNADTWGELVAGGLPDGKRAAMANHAAACEQCYALIAALVETGARADASRDVMSSGSEPDTGGSFEVGRGTQIGRYVIEERLGAGGMGVVYAARDSELHRRVAVKLLRPGQASGNARKRLLREARTLARLSHPNVVTVFDVGEHGGQLFVAMELVEAGSLNAWLRRTRRPPDEIIDRLLETARGLAAAHQAGVVHRDIKPDNILIGADGRARVTDFGLATPVDAQLLQGETQRPSFNDMRSLTRSGTLLGTPVYMAPEQLAGGDANARSDQWSFCMTLYEALAGVRPFVADLAARASAIREGRLAPPVAGGHVPGWVRRIVLRGLSAAPDERWPSIDAIVEVLAHGRHRRWRSAMLLPARQRRRVALAIAGPVVSIAAITTFAMARGGASTSEAPDAPMAGSANPPASASIMASTQPDDQTAVAKARIQDALAAFVTWSSAHRGAPCPSARDLKILGDAYTLDDPWGHAVAITCSDQPADQIAGAVSAGPDGTFGTADDLASWTLGPDVTDLVRGTRWTAAMALPPARSAAAVSKRLSNPIQRPAASAHVPMRTASRAEPRTGSRTASRAGPPPTDPPPPPSQPRAVDDNGIPTHRWGR